MGKKKKEEKKEVVVVKASNPLDDMNKYFKSIDKKMGGGVIKAGDDDTLQIKRLSTGIPSLDRALGGGIPIARHSQFRGPEHSGKSWICLHTIKTLHKNDKDAWAVYLDVEKSWDPIWAESIGIDINRVKVITSLTAEGFWDLLSRLLDNTMIKIIVLDSLALMAPAAELEEGKDGILKAFTTRSVATQAQVNTPAMRVVMNKMKHNSAAIIYINQVRYKIGGYGNPETTPGGQSIKHALSIDVNVRKGDFYPNKSDREGALGHYINARVVKNKTYKEQQISSFLMMTDGSLNEVASILALAKEVNYLEDSGIKKGNTYTINGEKVAGNIREFENYLKNDEEALISIREGVEKALNKEDNLYELSSDKDVEEVDEEEDS